MLIYPSFCRAYQTTFKLVSQCLDWREPQRLQGVGAVLRLPERITAMGLRRLLFVTDPTLLQLGLTEPLRHALEQAGIACALYGDVKPNPSLQNIEDALALYHEHHAAGIVAFGGGSAIDCAKGVAARVARPGASLPQLRGLLKIRRATPPLFAVPTTAGTGSECTITAVVTNPQTHEKYAITDPTLRPRMAVLDPQLTVGLPPHITATTGMDALTHAIEAFIGQSNTPQTEACALRATEQIFLHLESAFAHGNDLPAREAMLVASYDAGLAFTQAYVGYVHAISHALSGLYGLAHGLANAVLLPHVLEHYGSCIDARLATLATAVGIDGVSTAQKAQRFIAEIRAMNQRMGIPTGFACIRPEDIPLVVQRALQEANPLYPVPRIFTRQDCTAVVRAAMAKGGT